MTWFKVSLSSVFVLALLLSVNANGASELLTFDNDDLRDRYSELTFQLRCPKCQNQNVADSNAPISEDIRSKTYQMLHQGYSDQEIIDFMIERYTEFVIYKPQFSFVTMWLWLVPASVLLLGLWFLWTLVGNKKTETDVALNTEDNERLKKLMEDKS